MDEVESLLDGAWRRRAEEDEVVIQACMESYEKLVYFVIEQMKSMPKEVEQYSSFLLIESLVMLGWIAWRLGEAEHLETATDCAKKLILPSDLAFMSVVKFREVLAFGADSPLYHEVLRELDLSASDLAGMLRHVLQSKKESE